MTRPSKTYQREFEDFALQIETSVKEGKTIMSASSVAVICRVLADLCKELGK